MGFFRRDGRSAKFNAPAMRVVRMRTLVSASFVKRSRMAWRVEYPLSIQSRTGSASIATKRDRRRYLAVVDILVAVTSQHATHT